MSSALIAIVQSKRESLRIASNHAIVWTPSREGNRDYCLPKRHVALAMNLNALSSASPRLQDDPEFLLSSGFQRWSQMKRPMHLTMPVKRRES
jgi:hypothetical protein